MGTGLILCVCYCNMLVQYSCVKGYCCVCVTVMCWCSTFGYRVIVVCVLLKCVGAVHLVQGYFFVCVTVMCWCSTVG